MHSKKKIAIISCLSQCQLGDERPQRLTRIDFHFQIIGFVFNFKKQKSEYNECYMENDDNSVHG